MKYFGSSGSPLKMTDVAPEVFSFVMIVRASFCAVVRFRKYDTRAVSGVPCAVISFANLSQMGLNWPSGVS